MWVVKARCMTEYSNYLNAVDTSVYREIISPEPFESRTHATFWLYINQKKFDKSLEFSIERAYQCRV